MRGILSSAQASSNSAMNSDPPSTCIDFMANGVFSMNSFRKRFADELFALE